MSTLFDIFETSATAEASGAWVDVGPASFLLARAGGANENFKKTATKRLKPFQNALESMPPKAAEELGIGIFVDTILLDWKDVTDKAGNELVFSKENAKMLLGLLPNLFASLQAEAGKMSNFTQANLEAAAKN